MESFVTPIHLLIEIDSLRNCNELKKFGVIKYVDEMINIVFLVTCVSKVKEIQGMNLVQRVEVEWRLTLCS